MSMLCAMPFFLVVSILIVGMLLWKPVRYPDEKRRNEDYERYIKLMQEQFEREKSAYKSRTSGRP